MQIKLKKLMLQNFKGMKEKEVVLKGENASLLGQNASGKTSVFDSLTWVLFDKDSTGASKFQVRPLDAEGNQIDNVEIMVEATLDVDGKEVVLKKVQKQNWVKDRTTQEQKFKGNENEFEVNGYPKLEKDYKEYISSLVDEELFKLITNPQTFTSLPWKKQREMLMKLVGEVSDIEIAQTDEKFTDLISELEQASTDDIQKKYNKALSGWKKKQIEIPARIDEVSKQISDIDVAELELQRNALKEQIAEDEEQLNGNNSASAALQKETDGIMELKFEQSSIEQKAFEKLQAERKVWNDKSNKAENGFKEAENKHKMSELDVERIRGTITRNETEKKRLLGLWTEERAKTFTEYKELPAFDESYLICPTCGQALTEELKSQKIADYENRRKQHILDYNNSKKIFESEKDERVDDINKRGVGIVETMKNDKAEIEKLEAVIAQCKADKIRFNKEKSEAMEALSKIPERPDLSDNQEYERLSLEIAKKEEALKSMNTGSDYSNQLKIKIAGEREELYMVEKKIASADNTAVEERIAELQAEQKEIGQKVADQEKVICLLDEFIRTKMNRISESINAKFKTVSWKLFGDLVNGGIKETCECVIDGIPYAGLSNGQKIVAGLDIISSLSELYGVSAPIFIDNAEAISDGNLPDMDCQIILLMVASPIYEYEYEDKDGLIPKKDEKGNPIISKVVYDGSLRIEVA